MVRKISVVLGVFVLGGLAWTIASSTQLGWSATSKAKTMAEDVRSATGADATPVVAAFVERRNVPVYLTGLGTVQAFNSVTITSRVDGQLTELKFEDGQEVKVGQSLVQIDPRPYEAAVRQAEAQVRVSQAQIVSAQADLQRLEQLQKLDVGSRKDLDAKRADVARLQASIDAAEAQVESAKLNLEYTNITSPINGRTGLRQLDVGNMIMSTDRKPIVTVTQLQPISVLFSLPQEERVAVADQLAAGHTLKVKAYARDNKTDLGEGTLTTIDNQIDSKTGTFRLKATFPNEANKLWPGQFVTVRLLLMEQPDALVVSAPTVQRGPQGNYVYVIGNDDTVALRPVEVARVQDGMATIASGVAWGERVVVDGQFKLQPGSRVSISGAERPGSDEIPFKAPSAGTVPAGAAPPAAAPGDGSAAPTVPGPNASSDPANGPSRPVPPS